jgi:hypothetical protein
MTLGKTHHDFGKWKTCKTLHHKVYKVLKKCGILSLLTYLIKLIKAKPAFKFRFWCSRKQNLKPKPFPLSGKTQS